MKTTQQRVTLRNLERMKKFGKYGDTFDTILDRLLSIAEMEQALQTPPEETPLEKTPN